MLASSNWNNSSNAGLSYLNSNNVASNSNRNISAQLIMKIMEEAAASLGFKNPLKKLLGGLKP